MKLTKEEEKRWRYIGVADRERVWMRALGGAEGGGSRHCQRDVQAAGNAPTERLPGEASILEKLRRTERVEELTA